MLKKINLQLLAEQAAATDEEAAEAGTQQGAQTDEAKSAEKIAKTYTQEEVDRLVALQKAKLPDKAKLTAFEQWQAEQKKDEPINAEAEEARKELAKAQAELAAYRNREKVLKAGVAAQFADYATYEVSKLAAQGESDFDAELIKWAKNNEQYKAGSGIALGAEGMRHAGAPDKTDGVEAAFMALNPKLKIK